MIEEVEDSELKIIEQEYMDMLEPSLNTYRAFQTKKQRLEQQKKQNEKKGNCPICNKEMRKNNINKHINTFHKTDN